MWRVFKTRQHAPAGATMLRRWVLIPAVRLVGWCVVGLGWVVVFLVVWHRHTKALVQLWWACKEIEGKDGTLPPK